MSKKKSKKAEIVLNRVLEIYPKPKTELKNWKTDFQFLICVILSSQTTDVQVNKVTGKLFNKFPDLESFSKAQRYEVEELISSVNYYRTKASHIIDLCSVVQRDFDGIVPKNLKDLLQLPGVGKKTANVFLNEMFRSNEGIAVDTHVFRVARRVGLSNGGNPDRVASDLEKLYPKNKWHKINSVFVLFGRYYCKSKQPVCNRCVLCDVCSFACREEE